MSSIFRFPGLQNGIIFWRKTIINTLEVKIQGIKSKQDLHKQHHKGYATIVYIRIRGKDNAPLSIRNN